ncbi:MAG: DUF1178 family protein [Rhodospirillaceae bacterium]|nr:DUF1178 family protein [Rhodospirillaceae bacterium]
MILYDLICDREHQFDSWFRNSSVATKLVKAGQITCPTCGSTKVQKAIQSPRITTSKQRGKAPSLPVPAEKPAAEVTQAMTKMTEAFNELRKTIEKNFDHVGDKFPDEARKIHYGETPERGIYGEATPEQAKELTDEGINVYALPWPKKRTHS